jgi:hypothetical protein
MMSSCASIKPVCFCTKAADKSGAKARLKSKLLGDTGWNPRGCGLKNDRHSYDDGGLHGRGSQLRKFFVRNAEFRSKSVDEN